MINYSPGLATLQDVKEPTHYSKREGHGVPGVVAGLHLSWGKDLLRDHSNWLMLLQYSCQKLNGQS